MSVSLTMNDLEKLKVLERLKAQKITQIDAAKLLNKSEGGNSAVIKEIFR